MTFFPHSVRVSAPVFHPTVQPGSSGKTRTNQSFGTKWPSWWYLDGESPVTESRARQCFLICVAMGEYLEQKRKHISNIPSLKPTFQTLPWFYGSFQVWTSKSSKNMVILQNPWKFFFCGIVSLFWGVLLVCQHSGEIANPGWHATIGINQWDQW